MSEPIIYRILQLEITTKFLLVDTNGIHLKSPQGYAIVNDDLTKGQMVASVKRLNDKQKFDFESSIGNVEDYKLLLNEWIEAKLKEMHK